MSMTILTSGMKIKKANHIYYDFFIVLLVTFEYIFISYRQTQRKNNKEITGKNLLPVHPC